MIPLWIVKNWRVFAWIGAILAVLMVGWYIHGSIYQKGYNARVGEELAARAAADEQARTEIIKIGNEYENERQKIIQKGDSGHGVGGRVSDALDILQSRAGH